ncbi:MAG: type I secretion system permease/ATPase [Pseudomonadota bacterium]
MNKKDNPVEKVVAKSRGALLSSALFSCAINILMLTGPLFMLQVYDRVLTSRSVPTLITLFALVVALYLFFGFFDFIRSRILSRIGFRLDVELGTIAKRNWIFSGLGKGQATSRPLRDLTVIRQFMGSNGLPALFDLPWMPIYLAIVYLLHVKLGLLATAGAAVVVAATVVSELITKKPVMESSRWDLSDQNFSESSNRNAEAIVAMGMVGNISRYWETIRHKALANSQLAGGRTEAISAITKTTRMLMQSAILALGAYLAMFQEITPGTMIASSILATRALTPLDSAVSNWKNFVRARQSYNKLKELLSSDSISEQPIDLPDPEGRIEVEKIAKLVRNKKSGEVSTILSGINFKLEPGDGLGVIGPSASGKSSLARLLVGLGRPDKGELRFDGASFDQWNPDKVGKFVGYLPQSVELLAGTVAQNIARFEPGASDETIVAAAKLAGVHELILKLPGGYSTNLGSEDVLLSGGQAQRIALARAVYGIPKLVVMDEPNAHLDMEGDAALTRAIAELRKAGSCIVVMAHRPSAIAAVNKLLMLKDGKQVEFGPKDEVLAKVIKQSKKPDLRAVE